MGEARGGEDVCGDAEGWAEVCVFGAEDGELVGGLEFVGAGEVFEEVVEEVEGADAVDDVVGGT